MSRESARGRILVRRAAKQGEAGANGLTIRVTVWESGKDYRNDQSNPNPADGVRYLDICSDKAIDFTPSSGGTARIYVCKQTHNSSNHPLQQGAYWDEMNTMKPIATALILAETIKAKYLDVEDLVASNAFISALSADEIFANKLAANEAFVEDLIASRIFVDTLSADNAFITKLVAQNAFLENAIIRMLKSDEAPRKRIVIQNNELTMYDSSNKQKLLIKGENIDTGSPVASYPTDHLSVGGYYSGRGQSGQDQGAMTICTFHVDNANTQVIIPRLTIVGNVISQGGYGGVIESDGTAITLYKDGAFYSLLARNTSSGWGSCDYGGATFNLQPGTYTIGVYSSWEWEVDYEEPLSQQNWIEYELRNTTTGNILVASSSQQSIQIGANGIAIHLGNSFSAVFALDSNSNPSILMQGISSTSQPIGLRITSAGVQINRGIGWVNL